MKSMWIEEEPEIINQVKELKGKEQTEICVIGGGISGISIAYELTKRGKNVILLEKDKLAEKASRKYNCKNNITT
ncbi:MAG: FAD-dependent oxidoreductase [Clostridia bacterium]|jgi:glycerol-3-phosphate dehydrogenase|nr:FAD-dependent oxidoreductase [Clostridia bacterium]